MHIFWQITIPLFWIGVTVLLFLKNRSLAGRLEVCEAQATGYLTDLQDADADLDDLNSQLTACNLAIEHFRVALVARDESLAHALNERNDAMMHLEKTLQSDAADRVVPDRISVEAGINGIYYTFKYDPPEYAEVTPLPHLTGSTIT